MMEFISTESLAIITAIFSIPAAIFSFYKYFDRKKREQNQKEFEHFHILIKELVQPKKDERMYLDRQTAVIFELRNFERYHEYSLRMLKGLHKLDGWKKKERLNEEIELTISFIEKKQKRKRKVG